MSVVRRDANEATHARGAFHGVVGDEDAEIGARETQSAVRPCVRVDYGLHQSSNEAAPTDVERKSLAVPNSARASGSSAARLIPG